MSEGTGQLKRQIGVFHAVLLGLGSILGTGVFVSIGIAAGLAGPAVLVATVLAGVLALCNGLSSAQLAAAHPVAGGTYEYGYKYLHPKLGFTAGWMFLLAKSASAATALLAATGLIINLMPSIPTSIEMSGAVELQVRSIVAIAILWFCLGCVLAGVKRGAAANMILVFITLGGVLCFSVYGTFMFPRDLGYAHTFDLIPWHAADWGYLGWATAMMFVAYTGYGRIATLGEEVRHPKRTIPIAILVCLVCSVVLYLMAGLSFLPFARTPHLRSHRDSELSYAILVFNWSPFRQYFQPFVAISAITAMLGVLLNLVLGLSRVVLAMGRRRDLPKHYSQVNETGTSPGSAVLLVGVVIAMITSFGSVQATWSFSAFTVLIYYGITNFAALRLPKEDRLYPRFFSWAGLAGCLFLAWWVESVYWIVGSGMIVAGLVWHSLAPWIFGRPPSPGQNCLECGYDLRASADTCPECGAVIPGPDKATSPA